MTYGYEDAIARRVADTPAGPLEGSSGYFAPRQAHLDPALFDSREHLHPDVRAAILKKLYVFWTQYAHAETWSHVWLAGSGITGAWATGREAGGAPGDLDTLIGVNFDRFRRANPRFAGNNDEVIAKYLNDQMHDELWPSTERTTFGGTTYELTYYINPTGTDISAINPYAAYDVTTDYWTVHPVDPPLGFSPASFSSEQRRSVNDDLNAATTFHARYVELRDKLISGGYGYAAGDPHWRNAAIELHDLVRNGAALFDSIHGGRRAAFAPGGKGYTDYANYRWQAGKGNGVVPFARALKQIDEAAHREAGITDHTDSGHLLLMAALANGHPL